MHFPASDGGLNCEKDEMMSENNSTWSQDDLPPQIIITKVQSQETMKYVEEPLLQPLGIHKSIPSNPSI